MPISTGSSQKQLYNLRPVVLLLLGVRVPQYEHFKRSRYESEVIKITTHQLPLKLIMTLLDDNLLALGPNLSPDNNLFTSWHELDWKRIESQVKKLRRRIYSAKCRGDKKNLAKIQRLTVNSSCNLLSSIRRVTSTSSGKWTSGPDSLRYLTPASRMALFHELQKINLNEWAASPVTRIYIPKPDGRKRPLGIPNIKERVLQGVILNALEPEWEAVFEPTSYGFRPGKTVWDATHRIYTNLIRKDRLWVVEADIKGCFDNIDHTYLSNKLSRFPFSNVLIQWLKAGILDEGKLFPTELGTPQGGVISPLLCNIALDGIEAELGIKRNSQDSITKALNPRNRTLVRYADDFIVLCPTEAEANQTCLDLIPILAKRGLQLSEAKTKITHTFDGFDFLGFTFRHFVLPQYAKNFGRATCTNSVPKELAGMVSTNVVTSKKSVLTMSAKLNLIFHKHRGKPASQLIKTLNPVIRGYANSKRVHSCTRAMRSLDHQLFKLQLAWMRRSHPKKSRDWTIEKYFTHYRSYFIDNKWTFRCPVTNIICQQFHWHSKLRRWPSIPGSYSPDDHRTPEMRQYWIDREKKKFASKNVDLQTNFDRYLADQQDLICPVCDQSLLSGDFPLHRHHIVPTSHKGKSTTGNLLLLHLPCHQSVHYCSDPEKWTHSLSLYKENLRISRLDKKDMESFD